MEIGFEKTILLLHFRLMYVHVIVKFKEMSNIERLEVRKKTVAIFKKSLQLRPTLHLGRHCISDISPTNTSPCLRRQ